MAAIALAEPTLVQQIERWGQETNRPAEKVLEDAVQSYLDDLEKEAIRAETRAYWAMHAELMAGYPGEFVAIYHSEVVDHDQDVAQLETRVRGRFGLLPVLIASVRQDAHRELRWLGGKFERAETK